jgi:hypothetical protein
VKFFNAGSWVGMILLACICLCACDQTGKSSGGFAAGTWVDAWVEIWNTYDLSRVDDLFLRDDRLTYFSSEKEGVLLGIDAVRDHHRGFGFVEGGKEQTNKLWLEDVHTTDLDTTVIVTGIWFFRRSDGSTQRGPVTIVYLRQDAEYRIAHMNFSNYRDDQTGEAGEP